MSFGDYLIGVVALAAIAAPLALAAVRLRARLLPAWEGAPARLVEIVVAISILTVLLQVLGAVGLFEPVVIVIASIAIGAGVWLGVDAGEGTGEGPPSPEIPTLHVVIALAAVAFLAAHWATGLQDVWARGMLTFDTLWYHGPFAARIAESGSVWALHYTDPLYLNWFYPQNSELVHGVGAAVFERDLLSPLVNFGWLGVCLLAAWCIGRPYGVAPLSLLAVALTLDIGPMVPREAGTPANDVAPVALLLAAAAVLVNAAAQGQAGARAARTIAGGAPEAEAGQGGGGIRGFFSGGEPLTPLFPIGAVLVAGLAMGLALGTKLTIAGALAAMAVALPLAMSPGLRRRTLLVFLAGVAATAGFWFLRNLIHSGNPLPWLHEVGSIDLPGPDRGLEGRDNFTVAHYIFADPDTSIWSQYFYKPITNLLGPLWFLFLGLASVGAVLAIARPRTPVVRVLGVVAVVGAIAYLFTPLTAAGPEGEPVAFGINLRYLVPALALALALLPLEPRLTPERWRLPILAGGALTLLITSLYSDSAYIWDEPFASKPAAALIGVALIGIPVGIALLGARRVAWGAAAGAAAVLALGVIGWERQDDYLDARYTRSEDFRFQLDDAARWAKDTSGLRIGVAGTSGAFDQYVLYGDELSNRVQFIGRELPSGDFRTIANPGSADAERRGPGRCPEFRRFVNDGGYDYVVTTPELDLNHPATATPAPEGGWLRGDPAAREIIREGRTSIFEITGELDPATCGDRSARQS